jgi:hypothetical protein
MRAEMGGKAHEDAGPPAAAEAEPEEEAVAMDEEPAGTAPEKAAGDFLAGARNGGGLWLLGAACASACVRACVRATTPGIADARPHGAPLVAAPAAAAAAAAEDGGLPEGWAVAHDAQKRPYYWHTRTKKTVWEKPTADTPAE